MANVFTLRSLYMNIGKLLLHAQITCNVDLNDFKPLMSGGNKRSFAMK